MSNQTIDILLALVPVVVLALGMLFRMGQTQREELAHALDTALTRLRAGEIEPAKAKELILATGAVAEAKVDKVLSAVTLRLDDKGKLELYKDNVVPGVAISVNTDGAFAIDPTGVLNKSAHKLGKWTKKKLGIKLF